MKIITLFSFFFLPSLSLRVLSVSKPITKTPTITQSVSTLDVGSVEPIGFWDPLNVTKKCDTRTINYFREAELQHSRVSMLSMVILPTIDYTTQNELAVNVLHKYGDAPLSKIALSSIIFVEFSRMLIQYQSPDNAQFKLKDDVYPGNLFNYNMSLVKKDLMNKELSNGRVAMIASYIYMVQEVFYGIKPFHL